MKTVFSSSDKMSVAPAIESKIRRVVHAIGKQEKTRGTVTVVWAANETVRKLNRRFRRIDRTTDVLSFPIGENGIVPRQGLPRVVGDVIIAVPQAIRQAPRFHNKPPQEFLRLAVHGVYHLLGYDHHRAAEAAEMKKREAWAMRQ